MLLLLIMIKLMMLMNMMILVIKTIKKNVDFSYSSLFAEACTASHQIPAHAKGSTNCTNKKKLYKARQHEPYVPSPSNNENTFVKGVTMRVDKYVYTGQYCCLLFLPFSNPFFRLSPAITPFLIS